VSDQKQWDEVSLDHFRKYDAAAQRLGVAALAALVPYSPAQLIVALQDGNDQLNGLGRAKWDRRRVEKEQRTFGGGDFTRWDEPYEAVWELAKAAGKREGLKKFNLPSLNECVCVLKHVAKYYLAGAPGPDGPVEPYRPAGIPQDGQLRDLTERTIALAGAESEESFQIGDSQAISLRQEDEMTHSDNEQITIEQFIGQHGLAADFEPIAKRSDGGDWAAGAKHFRVTLRSEAVTGGPAFTVEFSVGSGWKRLPVLADVLDSLASDASWVDQPFKDWAAYLGFDPDSRKAEKVYRAVRQTHQNLIELLGQEALDELLYKVERL
jgi:hypothetical protein